MHHEAHARFDAIDRSYQYTIARNKDPFSQDTIFHDPFYDHLDIYVLNECAQLILQYDEFFPFCKSKSDVDHYLCRITKSDWRYSTDRSLLIFEIQANRFLRGMVRLIVGTCRLVSLGKLEIQEVRYALENQVLLSKNFSAPPQGLFLHQITYPDGYFEKPVFN